MEKSQKWIIGIVITLIISLGTIALLYWFPHCWSVNSLSTDGLAGLLGAVITSLVTLGALVVTTVQTRNQVEENRKEQNKKDKLDLLLRLNDNIADLCSEGYTLIEKKSFCMDEVKKIQKVINKSIALLVLFPKTKKLRDKMFSLLECLKNLANLYNKEYYQELYYDEKIYIDSVKTQKDCAIRIIDSINTLIYDLIIDIKA